MADAPDLPFLLHKFKEYNPNQDTTLIEKAYHFAEKAHEGQKRESGEPYFTHCRHVANILMDFNLDADTICAGLLHDTVEDTPVTKRTDDVPSAADTDAEDLMSFYGSLKNRPRDDGSPAVTGKASLLHLMSNAYKANIFVCLALDSVSITYNGDAVLGYTQKNILRGCNFKVLLPRVTDDVRTVMDDSFKDKMARGLGDGLALLCEYGQDYGKFRPIRIEE